MVRLSGELEDKLSIEIDPALVFEARTIGELAALLQRERLARDTRQAGQQIDQQAVSHAEA